MKQRKMRLNQGDKHKAKLRSGFRQHHLTASNSKFRSPNSYRASPPYIHAHINFYDTSSNDNDDSLNSNKYQVNSLRKSKWPNLTRLQTQLNQDIIDDSLPPYIKKYNRRNKQLINLLEGTISPNYDNYQKENVHQRRRQKSRNKWIEKNLFEEQRKTITSPPPMSPSNIRINSTASNATTVSTNTIDRAKLVVMNVLHGINLQSEPNALPGEHLSLSSQENDDEQTNQKTLAESSKQQSPSNYSVSPKVSSFLFHRVPSPKTVGTGPIGGGLNKQRLPFVAITDRRIGEARQRRVDSSQNILPLP